MLPHTHTHSYFDFMISTPLERAHDKGMQVHKEQHFEKKKNHQVLKQDKRWLLVVCHTKVCHVVRHKPTSVITPQHPYHQLSQQCQIYF